MNPAQKQFSLNRRASRKQIPISKKSASKPLSKNVYLLRWIKKMAALCKPGRIHSVDGTKAEYDNQCDEFSNPRFRDLVKSKRVAVVGPSRSILGSEYGKAIDENDLVVRFNHQWPIAPNKARDLGERMDILYHCCNGDYAMSSLFTDDFRHTRFVCFENNPPSSELTEQCTLLRIPFQDVTPIYKILTERLGSPPNTGLVAIYHLLSLPLAELSLFGMTFFKEPYYPGYKGDGALPNNWVGGRLPKAIWKHDLDAQYQFFMEFCAQDKRLKIDARSLRAMENS